MTMTKIIAGFINTKIMVDALKRAGRNVTRASLVNALESMSGVDYDGFVINYGKTSQLGHRYVERIVISRGERFLR